MDTPSQFLKQQQKQTAQDPALDPTQPVQSATQQPVSPVTPVGSAQKEHGPVVAVSEYVVPTETTPPLDQEVKDAGVKTVENPEIPKLHVEVKNTGLTTTGEAVQLQQSHYNATMQLPYTQQQVVEAEKAPPTEGRKWLAFLTELLSKRFGLWQRK